MPQSIEPPSHWPFTVALTGPIASGKSTAGRMFSGLGAAVIELIIVPDRFQSRIERQRPGAGDRSYPDPLRPLADLPGLRRLRSILDGEATDVPYLILEVPPMPDSGLFREVDRVLWLEIDESVQLARLKTQDDIDEARARRIRRPQPGISVGRALADDIIDNSGSRGKLQSQVHRLHHVYRRMSARNQYSGVTNGSYQW